MSISRPTPPIPHPVASPRPDLPPESMEDSRARLLTAHEAKAAMAAMLAAAKDEGRREAHADRQAITKIVTSADVKWFVGTMAVVAVAAVTLVIWFDSRAQKAVAPVDKRLTSVESSVHELAVDLREFYKSQKTGHRSERLERPSGVP